MFFFFLSKRLFLDVAGQNQGPHIFSVELNERANKKEDLRSRCTINKLQMCGKLGKWVCCTLFCSPWPQVHLQHFNISLLLLNNNKIQHFWGWESYHNQFTDNGKSPRDGVRAPLMSFEGQVSFLGFCWTTAQHEIRRRQCLSQDWDDILEICSGIQNTEIYVF